MSSVNDVSDEWNPDKDGGGSLNRRMSGVRIQNLSGSRVKRTRASRDKMSF